MGQFFLKNPEIGGNPKALNNNNKSCTSKASKRIRSLGERSAGMREENRARLVNRWVNTETGQGGAGLRVDYPMEVS